MVDAFDYEVPKEVVREYGHVGADVKEEDNVVHAALAPTNVLA